MSDFTNANSAHGPTVAAWFRDGRLPEAGGGDKQIHSLYAAVSRWERGYPASFSSLDRWVTFIGSHVSCIPEEAWRAERVDWVRGPHPQREEGLRLLRSGLSVREIADRLHVAPSSVRTWRSTLPAEPKKSEGWKPMSLAGGRS